ncbi:MAG: helix-turn-helix domain-containing protein [Gemmataceae bacterium]|nr:helix-turn-helix domain-containing protein [Gemmataceae bacterium]
MTSYLTVKAVAARWGVAKSTVYSLVASGRMPSVRFGVGRGTIRLKEEDVVAFEQQHRRDDETLFAQHLA